MHSARKATFPQEEKGGTYTSSVVTLVTARIFGAMSRMVYPQHQRRLQRHSACVQDHADELLHSLSTRMSSSRDLFNSFLPRNV